MSVKEKRNVPPLRFKGVSGTWEEKKLGEHLAVSAETNDDNRFGINDVLSVSGEFGVVNQIEFQGRSFAGASVTGYHVLHHGQVTYTKSPLKASPFGIIKANKGSDGIVSVLYGVYNCSQETCPDFVQCYFDNGARLNNYLRPLVNKGAKNTLLISDAEALEGDVCFPGKIEQNYIADCLRSVDILIESRAKALDGLRALKKAMLEKMFPRAGAKVPDVRFKGFEGEWEKKPIGEIKGTWFKAQPFGKSELNLDGDIECVHYGELFTEYGAVARVVNSHTNSSCRVKSKVGDIIFPASDVTPDGLGRCTALMRANVLLGGDMFCLRQHEIMPEFLSYSINNSREQILALVSGTTVRHVSPDKWKEVSAWIAPSEGEQQKVSKLLECVDSLIAARREEVGKLKDLKKALLDRMFV